MNKTCYRYSLLDLFTALTVTLLLSGCAAYNRVHNAPTTETVAFERLDLGREADESGDIWLFLAFSGGGTRAAAFSYGVLEELRETQVNISGHRRRLIDEVDVITGVSGGSFTALSYALYGDRLFSEYEERFLKRDVQGTLTWRTLNPFNWWKF